MKDELIYDGFRKSYPRTYYYANSIKLKPTRKYWLPSNMRSLSIIVAGEPVYRKRKFNKSYLINSVLMSKCA